MREAKTRIAKINEEFCGKPLAAVRPSMIKSWTAKLAAEDYEASYVYALHARLSQILSDAVHDNVIPRNPCSRRTSPPMGRQRPYVATTTQVWALRDGMPDRYKAAILLGAFAGLRVAEACGLRVEMWRSCIGRSGRLCSIRPSR